MGTHGQTKNVPCHYTMQKALCGGHIGEFLKAAMMSMHADCISGKAVTNCHKDGGKPLPEHHEASASHVTCRSLGHYVCHTAEGALTNMQPTWSPCACQNLPAHITKGC